MILQKYWEGVFLSGMILILKRLKNMILIYENHSTEMNYMPEVSKYEHI
jgi:hypothetical protein